MPVYKDYNYAQQYGNITSTVHKANVYAVALINGVNKKLFFSKGTGLHRTDGPARIVWLDSGGIERAYFINNNSVPEQTFKKVLYAPIEDLPLYLNIEGLREIAIDRMKGEKTSIISAKEKDIMGWEEII